MKKNKKIILILTFALLLTQFSPLMDIIKGAGGAAVIEENFPNKNLSSEVVNAEGSILKDKVQIEAGQVSFDGGTTKYHNKTYDGMEFCGEVEGNNLITYDKLISDLGIAQEQTPTISRYGHEEIYDKWVEEMGPNGKADGKDADGDGIPDNKGGIWLKFIDHKYTRDGKPRTFYVMKKPAKTHVYWSTLHQAGAIYGWDVIDYKTGKPKADPEKYEIPDESEDYQAKIVKINGKEYIVRLLQGKTNYGGDVTNTKKYPGNKENANSEWNRTILPITKDYRFGSVTNKGDYIESALSKKDGDDYKIQTADYNWFGDLTLGSKDNWKYDGKKNENLFGDKGQYNWVQELVSITSSYECLRGGDNVSYGAAYSKQSIPGGIYNRYGVRLVIEPYDSGIEYGSIKFRKIEDDGEEPEEGKVELGRYDDMAFFGEVSGKNLIAHEDLIKLIDDNNKDRRVTIGGAKPEIPRDGYEEIYDKNEKEEERGGVWLKFVDYKYPGNGKSRTFYVMKKPIRKYVSWNRLFDAGVVYGWDVINEDHSIKPNFGVNSNYKPCIKTINGQKYIVRLLRGLSNYGDNVKYKTGTKIYKSTNARNSEWNRTMVAITKQYRGEAVFMEEELKKGNDSYGYIDSDYVNQTASYNWFGDLTLGAWDDWSYNGKKYNDLGNLEDQGQVSWAQEFCDSTGIRSVRGRGRVSYGAAYSSSNSSDSASSWRGVRLVLEPLNTNN